VPCAPGAARKGLQQRPGSRLPSSTLPTRPKSPPRSRKTRAAPTTGAVAGEKAAVAAVGTANEHHQWQRRRRRRPFFNPTGRWQLRRPRGRRSRSSKCFPRLWRPGATKLRWGFLPPSLPRLNSPPRCRFSTTAAAAVTAAATAVSTAVTAASAAVSNSKASWEGAETTGATTWQHLLP